MRAGVLISCRVVEHYFISCHFHDSQYIYFADGTSPLRLVVLCRHYEPSVKIITQRVKCHLPLAPTCVSRHRHSTLTHITPVCFRHGAAPATATMSTRNAMRLMITATAPPWNRFNALYHDDRRSPGFNAARAQAMPGWQMAEPPVWGARRF